MKMSKSLKLIKGQNEKKRVGCAVGDGCYIWLPWRNRGFNLGITDLL